MPTVEEAKRRLTGVEGHVAVAIWTRADVMERAEILSIPLTDEDADNILDDIDRKQDSELGIIWITLDVYIQDYVAERIAKSQVGGEV